jgi:membrane protein
MELMTIPTPFRILFRAAQQFQEDGAAQMGASLAYYALFSIAPLLVLAVMLAGILFDEQEARERVRQHLTDVIGPEAAREITSVRMAATPLPSGRLATVLGLAALIVGAHSVFLQLRRCLAIIWRLDPPERRGVLATLLNHVLAILMVLGVGILLLLSLAASTALPVVEHFVDEQLPGGTAVWQWSEAAVSLILLTLFFALTFRVLSRRLIPWGYICYGSFISALLFTAGKMLISLYLAYTSTASASGAAGSLVVFLIWVYYSAQITFFGAELIQARRTRAQWLSASDSGQATITGQR